VDTLTHDGRAPSDYTFPSDETLECPYPFYAAMRSQEPVYKLPEGEVYFVTRWQDIVFVSEHPELFTSSRHSTAATLAGRQEQGGGCPVHHVGEIGFTDAGLSNSEGAEHRLKRQVALKLVAPERLRRFTPYIAEVSNRLIDGFMARGEVEFAWEFGAALPMDVVIAMLGVRRDDELFHRMMAQVPASAVRFISDEALERRRVVGEQMRVFMEREIHERVEAPRDDFISELVAEHMRLTGELPLDYLVAEATTLLFGGLVTTQHMFTNTMQLLLENPEQMARVVADPALVRPMLEESLRLESPFHLTETICTTETELAGVTIPAGAAVYKCWGSGNRDERRFPDADEFRIGRPGLPKQHLGFGRGNHRCLGAPLALLEGTVAFELLLTRCRDWRLDPERNDWTHVRATSFRSLNELHLRFEPAG
jgi:cytochrome P450